MKTQLKIYQLLKNNYIDLFMGPDFWLISGVKPGLLEFKYIFLFL
uniref:Uncharacterized protein n=1 Tax=Rhizophora mucronata TaxID=61149 RepID=A0A2P2P738_RHIMU